MPPANSVASSLLILCECLQRLAPMCSRSSPFFTATTVTTCVFTEGNQPYATGFDDGPITMATEVTTQYVLNFFEVCRFCC